MSSSSSSVCQKSPHVPVPLVVCEWSCKNAGKSVQLRQVHLFCCHSCFSKFRFSYADVDNLFCQMFCGDAEYLRICTFQPLLSNPPPSSFTFFSFGPTLCQSLEDLDSVHSKSNQMLEIAYACMNPCSKKTPLWLCYPWSRPLLYASVDASAYSATICYLSFSLLLPASISSLLWKTFCEQPLPFQTWETCLQLIQQKLPRFSGENRTPSLKYQDASFSIQKIYFPCDRVQIHSNCSTKT